MKTACGLVLASILSLATPYGHAEKLTPKKAPAKAPALKALAAYKNLPVLGGYTLRPGNGKEDPSIRLVFRPDGTWTWIGPNFKSEGRYWYKPELATLDYRKIDGKATRPGTVRTQLRFLDGHKAFIIDNRVYGKKGTPDYVAPVEPITPPAEGVTPPPPPPQ